MTILDGASMGAAPGSKETVRELMLCEAQALTWAANRLEPSALDDALALLDSCTRLVMIIGTGVSGIVAAKLAATFTSSGTPALFLHASNALHGGLGVAQIGDVAVAVSNSGQTEETLQVAERLRAAGIPVIALSGNVGSPLAAIADVVLDASVSSEACPLGILPTASSTVALALGDALAMTLAGRRGWTLTDLARVHPAGTLGQAARGSCEVR
jgi:arabinose-5-phosphate isomerase